MTEFFDSKLIIKEGLLLDKQTQSPFTGNCEVEGAKGSILNGYFSGTWEFTNDFFFDNYDIFSELFGLSHINFDVSWNGFYPLNETWGSLTITCELDFLKGRLYGLKKVFLSKEKRLGSSEQYKDSKRHGETKIFNSDGKLIILQNYKNGILHGPVKYFDTNDGICLLEGHFINGDKDGLWNFNHKHLREYNHKVLMSDGSMHLGETYYNNEFHLTSKNVNGSTKDKESYYLDEGTFKEANYKNNKLDGVVKEYFANGIISRISHFSMGLLKGEEKFFYEDGTLKIHKNHKIFENLYPQSRSHGTFKSYHPNGKINEQGQLVEGHHDGVWKTFNQNGSLISEETHNAEESKRKLFAMINISRAMSRDISDAMGGSEFMTDSEKDVFGD